jgi:hypothetical protein
VSFTSYLRAGIAIEAMILAGGVNIVSNIDGNGTAAILPGSGSLLTYFLVTETV